MDSEFISYISRLKKALESLEESKINELYYEIKKRINTNFSIHLIGNGGSAANASHIAGDFTKTFMMLGLRLNIFCASDNSCYLTATSNDIDYGEVYSSMVGMKFLKGDLIVYFSGSGNSINLVKCAQRAKKLGIKQVGIVGYNGGRIKELVDIPMHININDMEISEDVQLIIFHYIKQNFCKEFEKYKKTLIPNKYDKRVIEDIVS